MSAWLLQLGKNGAPEKFFDCGKCRDGSEYKDVTNSKDREVKAARARFAEYLATIPEPKPREGVRLVVEERAQEGQEGEEEGKSVIAPSL